MMEALEAFAPAVHERWSEQHKPRGDRDGAEKDVSDRPPKKQRVVTDKAEVVDREPLPPKSYLGQFKEADWSDLEVTVICDVDAGTNTRCFGIVKDNLRSEGSNADGGFELPKERDLVIKCLVPQGRVEIYCDSKWYPATVLGVSMPSEEEGVDQAAEVEQVVHKSPKKNLETSAQNPKKAAMKRRHQHMMAKYLSHLDALKARFDNSYPNFAVAFKSKDKEIHFRQPERIVSASGYKGVVKNRSGGGFGHRINDARINKSLLTGEVMTTAEEAAEQLAIITACGELWQKQVLSEEDHVINELSNVDAQLPTSPTSPTSPIDESSALVDSAMEMDGADDEELGVQGKGAALSSSASSSSNSSSTSSSASSE